ncbi:MAG: sigma-70 family RNA polymerase sigma factor [Caenispirillum bisanense]|nr:sigma-70 family RNA polymerase sigma factor [Caenispirillum bisanense]
MPTPRQSDTLFRLLMVHRRRLVRYARTIVGDDHRAEDVVQDAFLRLDGAVEAGPNGAAAVSKPVPYLYLVVRNLAVDARRRMTREQRRTAPDGPHFATLAGDHPTPEAAVIARDDLRRLEAALAELPERTRVALKLHRVDGLRLVDIAAELGVSVDTAHRLVSDALDHCRHRLRRS